ncbi:secreted protein containing DUF1592 [Rhodopirellula maiorica SM1]|uniref:Secreted protein containing DUF1592 n=1 Tax=Rhodopirellula maiorica SM1 TaxID=1265738 RepID=M5RL16_9BACT|nr:DUF1592 domain-containing protein [Rhodopirellula maiorica]EMI20005.1 secreted protein containing DUF1592 [Rhodopirellula maiorica SM1]
MTKHFFTLSLFCFFTIFLVGQTEAAELSSNHRSFLKSYCVQCHGPEQQEGELRLDTLSTDFADPLISSMWAEVLNSINAHEMPPEDEKQPSMEAAAAFAKWLESSLAQAEIAKRATRVVLRRMNRAEYNNTIRDLVGVDFDPAEAFPEDPPAGGFDNIGEALTMSPLQMELYYSAARTILDHALVEGEQPASIKWHFEPEQNAEGTDRLRVKHDGNNILLNDGDNTTEGAFTVVHHDAWNKSIGFRDFKVPSAGEYIIRICAAGRVPSRAEVVASAKSILQTRRDEAIAKKPGSEKRETERVERDLLHFQTDRMYDYGPPRVKVAINLGGTPKVIGEFDVAASPSDPAVYEVRARFTTEKAGVKLNNVYNVPRVLENFWMQDRDEFARPELLVDWIELSGPMYSQWPPESHARLLFDSPNKDKDENAYAREVIRRFMTRAYRRPVDDGEVDAKLALYRKYREHKPTFIEAIKVPLAAVLASPHFLYLAEPEAASESPRPLNQYELASRLSYFLWSSMPDNELFRLASRGELAKPEVLEDQVTRMLADSKNDAFVENFAGQWLGLRNVGANPPTSTLYPKYDRHLEVSMVQETEAFFAEILRHDVDSRHLIESDFVTVNERLARFYGIAGVKGDAFRRVSVPADSHRGGLVTQASIHCITSNGTRTSPVTRGVWVMKTMLGTDPGLPVANVGEIPTKVPGIDKATVRDRLTIHRQNPACARCHNKIDPLGFALENFNACGEWRDQEGHGYNGRIGKNDPQIDASAKMPDGSEFIGVEGLQSELLKNEDLFLSGLASKLTTYALGRELGFSDRDTVRDFVATMKRNQYTLRSLIVAIVQSEAFKTK